MKKLTILLLILAATLLLGCAPNTETITVSDRQQSDARLKYTYTARACNRDGCVILSRFMDFSECRQFTKAITNLHSLRKDAPTKILGCQEDF